MAANATFALKAGVWVRRVRLLIVSPDSTGTTCPQSGRNSTYPPVQISGAGSVHRTLAPRESLISLASALKIEGRHNRDVQAGSRCYYGCECNDRSQGCGGDHGTHEKTLCWELHQT